MSPVTRPSSSTYWIPPSRRVSTMNSTGTSSSSTGDSRDSTPRNYVDPWDLENYAYLRRHCSTEDSDPVVSLSTNGLDSAHSDFYFVPARQPLAQIPQPYRVRALRRPSLMVTAEEAAAALIEEEDFYNARCELRPPPCVHQAARRHSCAPVPAAACPDHDHDHHLLGVHPGLYERAKVRQMSTVQEPPPLVYVYQTPRQNRKPSRQFREYIQPISTSSEETDELYDELLSLARRRRSQQQQYQQQQHRHFGLSTFGHLKIDYSCNWSNLDRYIAHA